MISIELSEINKFFGKQQVLDHLSLHIPKGSIYGLLGPNGAGKTTTIRIINGLIVPNSGKILLDGKEIVDPELKEINHISGVLTENAGNYESLTALQNLIFFGQLYNLDKKTIIERSESLMKMLEIYDAKDKKVKTFSTGMKKCLNLVRALLPDPDFLFLDEPTSGLDPETSGLVNEVIKNLSRQGKTIILCTHQLKYAEEICTHYGFIKQGKVIAEGTYDDLMKIFPESSYLKLKLSQYPDWILKKAKKDKKYVYYPIKDEKEYAQLVKKIVYDGIEIYQAEIHQPSLTDLYFSIVEGGSKDENFHQSND